MKWNIYILLGLTASLVSCKNIEKMVDKGQYDEAILYAADKMQGEKYKETKYVLALEEAFQKVMRKDLDRIEYWKNSDRPEFYGRIYHMYKKIATRQERIRPFLPLISKDGYAATFQMINPRPYLEAYAQKDSEYHYLKGKELLDNYEMKDKESARAAYAAFNTVFNYFTDYKDTRSLQKEAQNLGTEHILVTTHKNADLYLAPTHMRTLQNQELPKNNQWTVFYNRYDPRASYDFEVVLRVEHIVFDREREVVNNYQREKEIQDGFRYVMDERGNVAKDTLGNDIKEPNYVWVKAHLTEVKRYKTAEVAAIMEFKDFRSGRVLETQEIVTPVIFEGYGFSYRGDKRALDGAVLRRMDNYLEPYPTDEEMIQEALEDIQSKAYKKIKRVFS